MRGSDLHLWGSEKPGWGIEIDEEEAAKAPITPSPLNGGREEIRLPDRTVEPRVSAAAAGETSATPAHRAYTNVCLVLQL